MKITLRELFLLEVIAAMGCGWWLTVLDRARLVEENQRRAADQQRANANLAIGWLQRHAPEGIWKGVEIVNEPPKEVP